jgi:anti-sigma factor RsiW
VAALAASLLLAVALGSGSTWFVLRPGADDRTTAAAVDAHVRGLMAARPTDIESGERHMVKPWFNGRIPQAPRVVDLKQEGFPLLGARIDVIGAAPVPTLVYGRRRHVISLSAVPDSARGEGTDRAPFAQRVQRGDLARERHRLPGDLRPRGARAGEVRGPVQERAGRAVNSFIRFALPGPRRR